MSQIEIRKLETQIGELTEKWRFRNPCGLMRFVDINPVLLSETSSHLRSIDDCGRHFDQSIARHSMRNPEPKNARFGQPCGQEILQTIYFQE